MSRSYNYPGDVPTPYVSAPVRSTAFRHRDHQRPGQLLFQLQRRRSLGFILAFVAIGAGLLVASSAFPPRLAAAS